MDQQNDDDIISDEEDFVIQENDGDIPSEDEDSITQEKDKIIQSEDEDSKQEKDGNIQSEDEDSKPEKVGNSIQEKDEITFEIVVGGSMRGRCQLKDSKGYTYTVKAEKGDRTWWRCSKRSNLIKCSASVKQVGNSFTLGRYPHEHPPFMKRMSTAGLRYRRPTWLPKIKVENGEHESEDENDNTSTYTCIPIEENNGSSQLKMKFLHPAKKMKVACDTAGDTASDIQNELIKIERERLLIDKQRLAIEKHRLEIERQRLEETIKHNSQCVCMNQTLNPQMNVLVQRLLSGISSNL